MTQKSHMPKGMEVYKNKGIVSLNELGKVVNKHNNDNTTKFNHMYFDDYYSLFSSVTIIS